MIHYITANGIGNAWVANELQVLEETGIPFTLHSMRPPDQMFFGSAWAQRINENTRILYPLPARAFLAMARAPFRYNGRFWPALWNALLGRRENLRARIASIAHLFVACYWAERLEAEGARQIHSQWINACGTIGMYGAWLLGIPFSFTGHAADLFRNRVALEDKIRRADKIVCISEFHKDFYREHGGRDEQFVVVHCGIDVDQFEYRPKERMGDPPVIMSVGRLVEKKGFDILIDACRILRDRGVRLRCKIGGDGPEEEPLRQQITAHGLEDVVHLPGEKVLQEDLAAFMYEGDIFAQPCVWSKDNDVDGTPRTLMEAMACGAPVISTRLAGIPDIVLDGETGLLVEPNDAEQLADAIERLIQDEALAARLRENARRHIEAEYRLPDCVYPLVDMYRQRLDGAGHGVQPASESASNPTAQRS